MERRTFVQNVALASAATALNPLDAAARWSLAWEACVFGAGNVREARRLDTGWRFTRGDVAGAAAPSLADSSWDAVVLPHTARVEALVTGEPGSDTYQWQGIAWYRRPLEIDGDAAGKKIFLEFEAAMNVADVFLDGERIAHHMGGYLPFVIDITDRVTPGHRHLLAVRLDNTDNPITGPKPLEILDFNMYGGLYRYVHLVVKDRLHITDPLLADRPASGGVFVDFPEVAADHAVVRVRTHVRNDHPDARTFELRTTIRRADGAPLISGRVSRRTPLGAGADVQTEQVLDVRNPELWSPAHPYLHTVLSEVLVDGAVVDSQETRIGIRRIAIDADGFSINGERMFLRGTNRHQEHPYVGYAVPAAAHYRDAKRIKDAGFDYIRLSHYPHAPAFMDACDELGLVVMNCIPGWQYFGEDPAFAELQYRNTRELVRRDRNHACVVLWEVSLNESAMPPEFVERTHAIAHEEYPGDQMYTCGWVEGYDVFIRARQHGGCTGEHLPCVVSEYGDWEYYAMTAGLDQQDFAQLSPDEQNSRQLRWHGERALLQQATNFQEAHNDNLAGPAIADGLWVMFDYNRGYAPDIESSGCMDIMRLPKYSRHFFRSQRDPLDGMDGTNGTNGGDGLAGRGRGPLWDSGPMAFIASEWTPDSPTDVRVFSNCDEVELRLNGRAIGRRRPDQNRISTHLAHPPFTFELGAFEPGTLEAIGYIGGSEAARNTVRTPGPIVRLALWVDQHGRAVETSGKDVLFSHAALRDANGTTVADAWENVAFGITGDARLVGANPFSSDAGIASILVETEPGAASVVVHALSIIRDDRGVRIIGDSAELLGGVGVPLAGRAAPAGEPVTGADQPPSYELRYTLDGSRPDASSRLYSAPIEHDCHLRAALVVEGAVVVELDESHAKFRIPGSRAPDERQPWE